MSEMPPVPATGTPVAAVSSCLYMYLKGIARAKGRKAAQSRTSTRARTWKPHPAKTFWATRAQGYEVGLQPHLALPTASPALPPSRYYQ